jgi:hypothetical protein
MRVVLHEPRKTMTIAAPVAPASRAHRNDIELLFARAAGTRPTITPGELYRRMSAEFKQRRAHNHGGCVMPMVLCRADSALSVNWGLEALTARCLQCEPIALDIAWRYAAHYDVWMPDAQPSLDA